MSTEPTCPDCNGRVSPSNIFGEHPRAKVIDKTTDLIQYIECIVYRCDYCKDWWVEIIV